MNKKNFDMLIVNEEIQTLLRNNLGIPNSYGASGNVWIGYPLDMIAYLPLTDVITSIDSYVRFAKLEPVSSHFQYNSKYQIIGVAVSKKSHDDFLNLVLHQDANDKNSSLWSKLKMKLKSFLK